MLYPDRFMICHKFAIHCICKLWTGTMRFRFFYKKFHFSKTKMAASRPFLIGWPSFLLCFVGQVMLHIPAKYQTHNLYGYGNFPSDMSKSGISAFKMAARLPSWIGSDRPNFLCTDGPYRDTSSYQIWPAYLIPLWKFPTKTIPSTTTDGRRTTDAKWMQ